MHFPVLTNYVAVNFFHPIVSVMTLLIPFGTSNMLIKHDIYENQVIFDSVRTSGNIHCFHFYMSTVALDQDRF